METTHWKHGDEFPVLDLIARFKFKSPSSLSFNLAKVIDRDSPRLPEMGDEPWDFLLESGSAFLVIGWLDAHHPSDPYNQLQLRVGLPDRYVSWESMRDLVPQVTKALQLPPDVPYHIQLSGLSRQPSTEEPQTEFGGG
jgi:hypothetical protein